MNKPNASLYIGLMSGTSVDGIDAVLVDFSGNSTQLVASQCTPWKASLKNTIQSLIENPNHVTLDDLGVLNTQLGRAYASAVNQLLADAHCSPNEVTAIGNHGQTVRHQPNAKYRFSLQLGNNSVLTERTGITTVGDFRARDIAAGGQGAPLVPAFHQSIFAHSNEYRVVANVGGISNITLLDPCKPNNIIGFDTGTGNNLMDGFCQTVLGLAYDQDGQHAAQGEVHAALLNDMLAHPYFNESPPKSTGRETFTRDWLNRQLANHSSNSPIQPNDVLATLCELTAITLSNDIKRYAPEAERVLVCGGGTRNHHLMQRLDALCHCTVQSTASYGLHPDWVEAAAFAWLAKQCIEGSTSNLPGVTGAQGARVLGAIYPV